MSLDSSPSPTARSHEFTVPIGIEVQVGGQTKIYDLVVKTRNPSDPGSLPEDQIRMIREVVQRTFEAYGIEQHGQELTAEHMSRIFREIKLIKGAEGNSIKDGENEPVDASTVGIHENVGRRLHTITAGQALWPGPRGPRTVNDTINGIHQLIFNRRASVSGSYSAEHHEVDPLTLPERHEVLSLDPVIPDRREVYDLDLDTPASFEDEWPLESPRSSVSSHARTPVSSHSEPRGHVYDLESSPMSSPRTVQATTPQSGGWGWLPWNWGSRDQSPSASRSVSIPDRSQVLDLEELESEHALSHVSHHSGSSHHVSHHSGSSHSTPSVDSFHTGLSHVSVRSQEHRDHDVGIVSMPLPSSGGYQAFAPADGPADLLNNVHLFHLLPQNAVQDPYPNGIIEDSPAYVEAQKRLRAIFEVFQASTAMDQKTAEFWAFLKAEVNRYQSDAFAAALALDRIFQGFKVYGPRENHISTFQGRLSS